MFSLPQEESTKGRTYLQWVVAIIVNINLLTYGMQAGWVSPSIKVLQSEGSPTGYPLSDLAVSWVGGTLGLAAAIGVPLNTYVADKYGRKIAIIGIAVYQALGWGIKLCPSSTVSIIVARAFCGLAGGGCFVVIPMYVKEISQDDIRGLLGSLLIMFQNIGFLFMYAIGAYLEYATVLWIVLWFPIVTMVLMVKAPESPAFLMKKGKIDEATSTIASLRRLNSNDLSVQREIDSMKKEDQHYKSLPSVSFFSILKDKAWRRAFFIMFGILTIHAFNGVFAIVTFASSVMSSSSSSALNPELQTLSFPASMIAAAFLSMGCVERFGRKPVLIISLSLTMLAMVCVATVVLIQQQGTVVPWWIPLPAIVVCVAAFAFGLSPVPFILLSEMFNFQIRAKLFGAIMTYTWGISFLQLVVFGPISNTLGLHGALYFFAGMNAIGLVITLVFLPETKGKTVEQIETELRGNLTDLKE